MNDERMHEAGMSPDYQSEMRRGLATIAVQERRRERKRRRAIATGALTVVAVAVGAVVASQALTGVSPAQHRAQPAVTETTTPSIPEPTDTDHGESTPPEGFEGVAAGAPRVLHADFCTGTDDCGDQPAIGSGPADSAIDAYALCGTEGTIDHAGVTWIDCGDYPAGSGFVRLHVPSGPSESDAGFATSPDFDGSLTVVDAGERPLGDAGGRTATVSVTCLSPRGSITVGGSAFDCSLAEAPEGEFVRSATLGAWGIPIPPGELSPRIERNQLSIFVQVSYVVER